MSDGEGTTQDASAIVDGVSFEGGESHLMDLSLEETGNSSLETRRSEKDPRKIARRYQLELCKKALEENIIVYLETGCGKTHIAVLLMHELGHLIRKPRKNICIFLAPTVALVHQQARVIEESTDFRVGTYSGNTKPLKNHNDWEKELEQYEVFVMTPQILLRSLYHCFINRDLIALLIFDECHHAQINSGHPYAEIMKLFDKADVAKIPRIFGMTASPVVGKGASSGANLPKCLNSLEDLLHAKVYSVEDKEELDSFVASPLFRIYDYGPVAKTTSSTYSEYCNKLEEIKRQCLLVRRKEINDLKSLRGMTKMLSRIHGNLIFCLEQLGLWGASHATKLLLSGNTPERNELIEAEGSSSNDCIFDKYLEQAAEVFDSDCTEVRDGVAFNRSCIEVLKEPVLSMKLLCLIGILSNFRLQPHMKCIIFVNRIVTARALSDILKNLKILAAWKCDFLVGVHSGLRKMSRRTMSSKLEKFRSGELNLLIATKVGEEGLDIQTCCLVIRFDLPETVASFIQSRGRARMPQSEYAFLVDRGNQKELDLIENFRKDEDRMNIEINFRTSTETFIGSEDKVYKVDSSGASISSGYSISLLHHYCAKLPHDEFFDPRPEFYYFDDGGTICHIILPSNAPIHQLVSAPHPSKDDAKRDACLKAIEELHKRGALSDYLLPEPDHANKSDVLFLPDTNGCKDEGSREELHEMLVPEALRNRLTSSENPIYLSAYYMNFNPIPKDRLYKEFGLFVKAPLPREAERMELELHLARGRSVLMNLVPSGSLEFDSNEIILAENFQEMFLKVLLDRSDFAADFVPLGKNKFCQSGSSTFYLLLPVTFHDCRNTVTVDWRIVQRCLLSPVFRNPSDAKSEDLTSVDDHLFLFNGWTPRGDIVNSLVYTPCKKAFFFVNDIIYDKNGYSSLGDSRNSSHIDHYRETYGISLRCPNQPLLQLKPLFLLHNLLHNRKSDNSEPQELKEYFTELPPELCHVKIIGFSKNIGSSLSLLPSIMHRLESLLVAIELKEVFRSSFREGAEVSAHKVLEALTTEKCQERFSLERLEILGDAFLKFAISRRLFLLHDSLDEGGLTRKRSSLVNNSNLYMLACNSNLQVYIRDQNFDPHQFFALGRPCTNICNKETEEIIHCLQESDIKNHANGSDIRCSKGHQLLQRKTIADVVEALVGAFLVDSGFKGAIAFLKWIGIQVDFKASQLENVLMASTNYLPLSSRISIPALESSLGYKFRCKGLLLQAFVHPSYNKHGGGCYQRLEFLGDAVLDYLITSYVFSVFPKLKPGQLTDLRSVAVNNSSFADVAVKKSFHNFVIYDSSALSESIKKFVDYETSVSEDNLLEPPKCPKALGDLVESCMGAILLDTGFNLNFVWKVMLSFLNPVMSFSSFKLNPIRELQEICQSHNLDLEFLTSKNGRSSLVEAKVAGDNLSLTSDASNLNKKEATRIAAQHMCQRLKEHSYVSKSKSLEDVLKSTCRMEPKLIGYNETPSTVTLPVSVGTVNMKIQDSEVHYKDKTANVRSYIKPLTVRRTIPPVSETRGYQPSETTDNCSCSQNLGPSGGVHKKTARSLLYEICAANCWKPPVFECFKEEGLSHLKSFTFKVVVQLADIEDLCMECFGNPKLSKKAAAENAAEGLLWYLGKVGYLDESVTGI